MNFSIIAVILLILSSCSTTKTVKTNKFDEFVDKNISKNEKIESIDFKFRRPQLDINIIVRDEFDKDDLKKFIEDLKPYINKEHMEKIAHKYWTKNEMVWSIYVNFYNGKINKNNLSENLIYKVFTNYHKIHNGIEENSNLDEYKTWYIDIDERNALLDEYLNE